MKNKGLYFICLLAALTIGFTCSSALAKSYDFGNGQELTVMGYMTQSAQYGLHEDYNTERGFNQLLTNVLAEADYRFADTAKFFVSGMFSADWIYDVKRSDSSWNRKRFDKSRVSGNSLYMDNEYWQLLKEAHITWNPGNFLFRFGKQVVAWGEMDGIRLMDQINPQGNQRGFADVEFENSIIPIWLARAEYNPKINSTWLTDLNLQFVFNPNVTFIPNQNLTTGNDAGGIWAPQAYAKSPFFPLGSAHIGKQTFEIDRPKNLDPEGFGYAFRINGNVLGGAMSLNYFYGREKDPASYVTGAGISGPASDGRLILNPVQKGFYPLFRFVGGTYSRDIPFLRSGALGGVAPTLRIESIYAFNNTFGVANPVTQAGRFIHSDEFRFGVGFDWKVKIPVLNDRAYFTIMPQFYYRRIMDYPKVDEATGLKDTDLLKTNYVTTLMVTTSYMHSKLSPMVFWMRDWRAKADMFKLQLAYSPTEKWQYALGAMIFDGSKRNVGFDNFSQKDYVFTKISYKFD
jgi:hypothetical protein